MSGGSKTHVSMTTEVLRISWRISRKILEAYATTPCGCYYYVYVIYYTLKVSGNFAGCRGVITQCLFIKLGAFLVERPYTFY